MAPSWMPASSPPSTCGWSTASLTTQLLYVAASLDVGGASPGDHAGLARVLRGLVAEGMLGEDEEGRYLPTSTACSRAPWPDARSGRPVTGGR